ncbi:hypothetical protein C8J57DRAFT_1238181 [Mycena rebaudengoi]|nr:hypothetical protein C8J57DRAFT_1238181 [Mycena rebaudengoi]
MRLTIALGATVLSAIQVNAQTLAAWTGSACNGDQGLTVPCDGSCHSFVGRHSFEVFGTNSALVHFFVNAGCVGPTTFVFGPDPPGECINVNTGTTISSFFCNRPGA